MGLVILTLTPCARQTQHLNPRHKRNEMGCDLFKLSSQSGGYYIHFRCSSDEGNRHTTWYESYWTFFSGQKLYMKQMGR